MVKFLQSNRGIRRRAKKNTHSKERRYEVDKSVVVNGKCVGDNEPVGFRPLSRTVVDEKFVNRERDRV